VSAQSREPTPVSVRLLELRRAAVLAVAKSRAVCRFSLVAEGVDDPTHSPAVLLTYRSGLGGTDLHGLTDQGSGSPGDKQPSRYGTGRRPNRLGSQERGNTDVGRSAIDPIPGAAPG
jgi:hypothetical protein